MEDVFVIGFRRHEVIRPGGAGGAEKIIRQPPLGLRGQLVRRKLRDIAGEKGERIGLVAGEEICLRPGILHLEPERVGGVLLQPVIIAGQGLRPILFALIGAGDGKGHFRQQR